MKEITTTTNDKKIANSVNLTPAQVAIIKHTVAKGTSDIELAFFLQVSTAVDLNPLLKEIWCYKDNKGNLIIFAGRDGFLKNAQRNSRWQGMSSGAVYQNDECLIDQIEGKIKHMIKPTEDRGELIGAYCVTHPKGVEKPVVRYVNRKDWDKGYNVWKTNPESMILKVAETHCLKKAFGINGIQSEYDFEVKKGVAIPLEINEVSLQEKFINSLEYYEGKDKEELRNMALEKHRAGEFDLVFYNQMMKEIGENDENL